MNLLFIFLSFCCGLLAFRLPLFILPFLLLLVRTFKNKLTFTFVIVFFALGLIIMIISNFISKLPFESSFGLITKAGTNHIIVLTVRGKFYVRLENNKLVEGDIILLNGYKVLTFKRLEGEFNYAKYLENKGIKSALNLSFYELKVPSLLRLFNKFTVKKITYPPHLEHIKNLLLIKTINYVDPFIHELIRLDLLFLISLTGAHLSFLRRVVKKISSIFFNELHQEIISYLCLIPLFLLNITKFAFYRIFLTGILRLINKKHLNAYFNSVELTCIAAFFFLVINPYFVFDPAFYLAYLLTLLFQMVRPSRSVKGRLQSSLIVMCVIVPYNIYKRNI